MINPQKSKKIRAIFFACFYVIVSIANAQINETISHSSIENLNVSYSITNADAIEALNSVVSKSIITLKAGSNVAFLHFKILNVTDRSIIYQADYSMNASPMPGTDGLMLFRKEGFSCYVVSPVSMPIGVYEYELSTEDSQGMISEIFTEFK